MHFLAYKESYSRCHDGADKTQIVLDAQKKFVKNHIGRWVPLFCRMLVKKADSGLYKHVADLMADWMDFEAAFLGVIPQTLLGNRLSAGDVQCAGRPDL